MRANTKSAVTELFGCPCCGTMTHSYGHLGVGESFGPWYCDDCGESVVGVVTKDGVDIKLGKERKANTLVLLRMDREGDPVHIVVEGMVFYERGCEPKIDRDHDEYFYNEHTCPWNYLRLPIKVGDDCDPHGLFVHQETVFKPEGYDGYLDNYDSWKELFSSLTTTSNNREKWKWTHCK